MSLDITQYYPTDTFSRNSLECVLCKIRQKLIKQTPEENIRQAFIDFLITEKAVPKEQIDIEIPLSRIKKGDKKRADIIVYGDNEKKRVVLVVECKKNDLNIIDKNIEQVKYYNTIFKANCIIVTNGKTFETYKKFGDNYKQLSVIPTFKELRDNHNLKKYIISFLPYQRHSFDDLALKKTHNNFRKWGHIGVDTPKKYYSFLSNFIDFIYDKNTLFENLIFNGIKIIKDLGTRYNSFGNGGGGSWEGEYKSLLIRDRSGNHLTIGIAILAGAKAINHPRFGTTKGYTYLVVSLDDFEKSHNSLQLNLDKNIVLSDDTCIINHDGKLSNGHSGSIPMLIVKNYIHKKASHLVKKDKIQLGIFSSKGLIDHYDKNAIQFIKNLIEYAILRDELRRGER